MNQNKLQDMKKNHLYMILNEIYLNKDATINELMEKTHLSQPSIRNMLRSLQKQNIIQEIGNDSSTGGRCPTRFSLNQEEFHVLCLFIQNHVIHFHVVFCREEICFFELPYESEEKMISQIQKTIQKYAIHCCVIGVEGIVQGYHYITDHYNVLEEHTWIDRLQASINIPVCLENDVKAMHYGQYLNHPLNPSFYLHINELGIGGSYMNALQLMRGYNGIAGEIGLIPYQGEPLNLAIRKCQNQDQFNQLLRFILTIIIASFDPLYIHLSMDNQWQVDILNKRDYLSHFIPLKTKNHIEYHQDFTKLMFDGLQYIGIQQLIK